MNEALRAIAAIERATGRRYSSLHRFLHAHGDTSEGREAARDVARMARDIESTIDTRARTEARKRITQGRW